MTKTRVTVDLTKIGEAEFDGSRALRVASVRGGQVLDQKVVVPAKEKNPRKFQVELSLGEPEDGVAGAELGRSRGRRAEPHQPAHRAQVRVGARRARRRGQHRRAPGHLRVVALLLVPAHVPVHGPGGATRGRLPIPDRGRAGPDPRRRLLLVVVRRRPAPHRHHRRQRLLRHHAHVVRAAVVPARVPAAPPPAGRSRPARPGARAGAGAADRVPPPPPPDPWTWERQLDAMGIDLPPPHGRLEPSASVAPRLLGRPHPRPRRPSERHRAGRAAGLRHQGPREGVGPVR